MPPTLHHWTSVSPRGPSAPHSQTKFKFTCVPKQIPTARSMRADVNFTNLEVSGCSHFDFLYFYDGFWLALGGVKLKRTTSGPNPWFWAQNHKFGPDVVIFGCDHSQNNQKSSHLAQTDGLGPRTWVWTKSCNFWFFSEGFTPKVITSGPNPGSRPENLGLGPMRSFWGVGREPKKIG